MNYLKLWLQLFDIRKKMWLLNFCCVNFLLSSPLAVKGDIAVAIFVRCMCMPACIRPSGFVRAITPTFMHGFQNYLAQLLFLRRRSAI